MTGDSTTSRCGVEQRQQRLPQHPIKTDEIEILESAGGDQPDKVIFFLFRANENCFRFSKFNVNGNGIDFTFPMKEGLPMQTTLKHFILLFCLMQMGTRVFQTFIWLFPVTFDGDVWCVYTNCYFILKIRVNKSSKN